VVKLRDLLKNSIPKSVSDYTSRKFDKALNKLRFWDPLRKLLESDVVTQILIPRDLLDIVDGLKLSTPNEEAVFRYILAVSLFNGILVGLPGTLGWGVVISQAVELLMAYQIGRMTGLFSVDQVFTPRGLISVLSGIGISAVAVTQLFGFALNAVFNVLSNALPSIMPVSFIAVTFTTLFYGLLIYLVFTELVENDKENLSLIRVASLGKRAATYTTQLGSSISTLLRHDTPKLLRELKESVTDLWYGATKDRGLVRGDLFLNACLVALMTRNTSALDGPFSQHYLNAWRMANPSSLGSSASVEDILTLIDSYSSDQLTSVHRGIAAKFYEILETKAESYDQDGWTAEIVGSQNNPGFDAVLYNEATNTAIEINYKLTADTGYIESHLAKYPDIPVIAPPEIADKIEHPLVWGGEYSYDEIYELSDSNFQDVLGLQSTNWAMQGGIAGAGLVQLLVSISPFLVAYSRKRISATQLREVFLSFLPEVGIRTANRLVMLAALGPVYAMALVAKTGLAVLKPTGDSDLDYLDVTDPSPNAASDEEAAEPKRYSRRDVITLFWPRADDPYR